jgi:hypothetical protein
MEIKVIGSLDKARQWADGIADTVRAFVAGSSENQELTGVELWSKVSPPLEKALTSYDKRDSESLPDTAWFVDSKARCQKELDEILDAVIVVLEACGAAECRREIRHLQVEISESSKRVVQFREQALCAPSQSSLSPPNSLWTKSREDLAGAIANEEREIEGMRARTERLKLDFRDQLQRIGLAVAPDEADSLLLPVQDAIVSMAAVITNVARLTEQLEGLVEESRELPSHTRRYYGIYVLLVYAIDRIQMHFIEEIDNTYLPKLYRFEQDARLNTTDAQAQISRGGPREQLTANTEAGKTTIKACRFLAEVLRKQRGVVAAENECNKRTLAAAANTYKTVRLSLNVGELMSDCQTAFRALRQLRLPRLRPFQNLELKEELQSLAEHLLNKEE